jgi:hypothetical protein
MNKYAVTEKGRVSRVDFFIGLSFGILIGITCIKLWEVIEPFVYPIPNEIVCQNGKAFEAVAYGSSVYLKTGTECLDTRLTEGGK